MAHCYHNDPNDPPASATPCAVPVHADSGLGCILGFGQGDISQYDTNRGSIRTIHALTVKSLGWSLNMEDHRGKERFSPRLTCLVSELGPKIALLLQSRRQLRNNVSESPSICVQQAERLQQAFMLPEGSWRPAGPLLIKNHCLKLCQTPGNRKGS